MFEALRRSDSRSTASFYGLKRRRITALIGPNGAGKTTLFSIITGFQTPTAGSHPLRRRRHHRRAAAQAPARRGIARTFQIVQPFAGLTVAREHRGGRASSPLRGAREALDAATEVGEAVGLGALLDKPASALTVAGRKRLELARALATEPNLLLLDEVLAGLNPSRSATWCR